MLFSKTCEYGIRATLYIAMQSLEGQRASLKDIARKIDSPEAFTAKILQQLSRNNIIESVKGPNGGFEIQQKNMLRIRLSQIVLALEGDAIYKSCGLGLKECSEKRPCPVHDQFKSIRQNICAMLEDTNLYELSTGLKEGLTFLKR